MSNTVKVVVALALTAVTATGALAASRHRGVHPRAYSGYAYAPYKAYRNLGPPHGWARGWAYAHQAYWRAYTPAYAYNLHHYPYLGRANNPYPYLGR